MHACNGDMHMCDAKLKNRKQQKLQQTCHMCSSGAEAQKLMESLKDLLEKREGAACPAYILQEAEALQKTFEPLKEQELQDTMRLALL